MWICYEDGKKGKRYLASKFAHVVIKKEIYNNMFKKVTDNQAGIKLG